MNTILAHRKQELENYTLQGPLRIFPEEQWVELLSGPGIDGPGGAQTHFAYTQETIAAARKSLSWHTLPVDDRSPESYFVFGDGQVLVPRMEPHQPIAVNNPFRPKTHLPFPPPAPFVPKTFASMSAPPKLPERTGSGQVARSGSASITSSAPQGTSSSSMAAITPGQAHAPITSSAAPSDKASGSSGAQKDGKPDAAGRAGKKDGEYSDNKGAKKAGSDVQLGPDGKQRCPEELAGYCRAWNIAHQKICPHSHLYWSEANDPTGLSSKAKFGMQKLVPGSPEFDYIKIRFLNSWIHTTSKQPTVTKIKQVSCPHLEKLFNKRQEAIAATGVKPNMTELYHGTCEANFPTLFTQGFQPPADYAPHPQCPVSGPYADKLPTSLCKRTCRLCTSMPRHSWNMCHMWGFGIYCAIDSSKSDLYVSNKKGKKSDKTKRKMLLCSVILGEAENVKLLKTPGDMHDRVIPAPGKHSIFALGFKNSTIPTLNGQTLGVMNDEYIVFHPHQILPLYIIEYSK